MTTSQGIDPLAGIWAKMERANEHFEMLDREVRSYGSRNPYDVVRQEHPNFGIDGRDYVAFVLHLREETPLRLSTILGDCIHNLRSVLDYLACQLVIAAGNKPRRGSGGTQFPIYAKKPMKSVNVVPGVQSGALTLIESFQPYHDEDNANLHPLTTIQQLSNADKHRNLVTASAYVLNAAANLRDPKTGQVLSNPISDGFLYDDAVIGWYVRSPGGLLSETDTEVQVEGSTTVSLPELEGFNYVPIQIPIQNALDFVEDTVIPALTPFLQ